MSLFIEKYYGKLNKFYYFLKLYKINLRKISFFSIYFVRLERSAGYRFITSHETWSKITCWSLRSFDINLPSLLSYKKRFTRFFESSSIANNNESNGSIPLSIPSEMTISIESNHGWTLNDIHSDLNLCLTVVSQPFSEICRNWTSFWSRRSSRISGSVYMSRTRYIPG